MNLHQYTNEQLEKELEQRKLNPRPALSAMMDIDWARVRKACVEYIEDAERYGRPDSNIEHYIFEAALQAVYGPNVFKWMNETAR